MIFARRGINIEAYPSVLRHLQGFRDRLEPKPSDWEPSGPEEIWKGRKEGLYRWYEIQDSTEYFIEFEKPKIIYQAIQFYPSYAFDTRGMLLSNKAFFLPVDDTSLISVLNSPIGWWIAWRHFLHMKDEALSNDGVKLATFSVPVELSKQSQEIALHAVGLPSLAETIHSTTQLIHDWLRHEFGLDRPGRRLAQPHTLSSDEFIASVRAALAKNRKLTSAEIARLKEEHAGTVEPAREAAAEMLTHERALSDLVNAAYGLTPQEVGLMWRTAPPPHAARSPDGTTPARCGQLAPEAADTALRKATALESFCFVLICRTEMRCGSGDVTVK